MEYDERGKAIPPPTPEPKHMLTRSEAIRLVEALDEAGFSCLMSTAVGSRDSRRYEVSVNMMRLSAHRLGELQDVIASAAPDAHTQVGDTSPHLDIS